MPFNGSGVFNRIYSWVVDATNSIPISANRTDQDSNDIALGLTNCVTRDGQSPPTANLPMGGYKLTNCANAALSTEYVTLGQANGAYLQLSLGSVQTVTGGVTFTNTITLSGSVTATNFQTTNSLGIGTNPTSVPGIGNPVVGANNLVMYNAGNIGISLLTDNASARTQQIAFGAPGNGAFDAGLAYNTSTRLLALFAGNAAQAYVDTGGNVGIGTAPTSVPSVGNPVIGAHNLIAYNAGNIGIVLLTDNGAARTSQIGFGSQGIGTFDAGMQYNNSTRTLSWFTSNVARATLDTGGNFATVGSITPGGGRAIAKVTLANTAPGALAAGELYLQY